MTSQAAPQAPTVQEVDLLGGFGDDIPAVLPTPATTVQPAKVSLDGSFFHALLP